MKIYTNPKRSAAKIGKFLIHKQNPPDVRRIVGLSYHDSRIVFCCGGCHGVTTLQIR